MHSDKPVSRAYSVASRPQDEGRIVLNIRLATPPPARPDVPPGIVSSWLFGLEAGPDAGGTVMVVRDEFTPLEYTDLVADRTAPKPIATRNMEIEFDLCVVSLRRDWLRTASSSCGTGS